MNNEAKYRLTLEEAAAIASLNRFTSAGQQAFSKMDGYAGKFNSSMSNVATKMSGGMNGAMSKVSGGLRSMVSLVGSFGALAGFTMLTKEVATLGMNMEQTRTTYEVLMGGNKQAANGLISELQKFADITPFATDEVLQGGRALLAAKVPASELIKTMQTMGDVASLAQIPFNEFASIMGKMKTGEFAQNEDLNQLAERGVPIFDELGKMLGKNTLQVKEMASKNQISYAQVQEAMGNMSKEGGIAFGMMDKQSKTVAGRISTLTSTLANMGTGIGEAMLPALGTMVDGLQTVVGFASQNKEVISGMFTPLLQVFVPIKEGFMAMLADMGLTGDSGDVLKGVFNAVGNSLAFVADLLKPVGELLGFVFKKVGDLVGGLRQLEEHTGIFSGLLGALKAVVANFAQSAMSLLGGVVDMITPLLTFDYANVFNGAKFDTATFSKGMSQVANGMTNQLNLGDAVKQGFIDGKNGKAKDFFATDQKATAASTAAAMSTGTTKGAPTKTDKALGTKGVSSASSGGSSGASEKSAAKTITITIENLVRELSIHATNISESKEKLKNAVVEALETAVNDVSISSNTY